MLPTLNPSEIGRPLRIAVGVAGLLLLGACACACPARAGEMPTAGPGAEASRLVEEVLRKAGDGDLGEWTRSIMDRTLERADEAARQSVPESSGEPALPLPAKRHADAFAGKRPASAEVLIFTSLSVPAASWQQWAHDAARTGVPLVLRGVGAGGLRQTAGAIRVRLGSHETGPGSKSGTSIAIDPRLFRLFGIVRVPAVVVVPGGVPPCESRGCTEDPAPPHDLVAGNIGLDAALEAVAAEGDAGRAVAKTYLGRLTGDGR